MGQSERGAKEMSTRQSYAHELQAAGLLDSNDDTFGKLMHRFAFPLHHPVCSTDGVVHSLEKTPAFILCYNNTSDVSMGSCSIRRMRLLPGSRRPPQPAVHDPIQPELLEFSREFDAVNRQRTNAVLKRSMQN
jgi:hypothetical protein